MFYIQTRNKMRTTAARETGIGWETEGKGLMRSREPQWAATENMVRVKRAVEAAQARAA